MCNIVIIADCAVNVTVLCVHKMVYVGMVVCCVYICWCMLVWGCVCVYVGVLYIGMVVFWLLDQS